jgi:hypothetical protein
MLLQQTMDFLYAMKLNGMADGFKEQMNQPDIHELSFDERFSLLVDRGWGIWRRRPERRSMPGPLCPTMHICCCEAGPKGLPDT